MEEIIPCTNNKKKMADISAEIEQFKSIQQTVLQQAMDQNALSFGATPPLDEGSVFTLLTSLYIFASTSTHR